MTDTHHVINIAQSKLQQLVGQNTARVRKPKQRVIRKNGAQAHRSGMQYGLMTETAQTGMPVHDLNLFPQNDVPEDGEEGEDGREGAFSIDDQEGNMIDFESVREVSDSGATFVGMRDDDDLVPAVNQFGGELVDVAFDSSGLGEEEVADHGDVVRHRCRSIQ